MRVDSVRDVRFTHSVVNGKETKEKAPADEPRPHSIVPDDDSWARAGCGRIGDTEQADKKKPESPSPQHARKQPFGYENGPWERDVTEETLAHHAGRTRSNEAPSGTLVTGSEPQPHAVVVERRPVMVRSTINCSHSPTLRRRHTSSVSPQRF